MMKKTLCFLFVLALIAQICARPDDKPKDDKAKDAVDKAKATADKAKDVDKDKDADKLKDAAEKVGKDAKKLAVNAEAEAEDDIDQDKAEARAKKAAAAAEAHAHKHKHGGKHHGMGDMIRNVEKAGKKFVDEGTEIVANMFDLF